jgi:hypothetical protein
MVIPVCVHRHGLARSGSEHAELSILTLSVTAAASSRVPLQARQADAAAAWVLELGVSRRLVERKRRLWARTGVPLETMQANHEALHAVLGMSPKQVRMCAGQARVKLQLVVLHPLGCCAYPA